MSPRSGNGRRLISVLDRTGLPGEAVDDVVLGHSYPTMEPPRDRQVAALDAGSPPIAPCRNAGS
jgi:acetyl-CoA C-acetyltransferase